MPEQMENYEGFSVQIMFEHYMKLTGQNKGEISMVQYVETKKAFMAGISSYHRSLIAYMNDTKEPDLNFLDTIEEQLVVFWNEFLESDN